MQIQKYTKSCCHKTNQTNYLMTQPYYWKPQVRLGLHRSKKAGLLYTRGGRVPTTLSCDNMQ